MNAQKYYMKKYNSKFDDDLFINKVNRKINSLIKNGS